RTTSPRGWRRWRRSSRTRAARSTWRPRASFLLRGALAPHRITKGTKGTKDTKGSQGCRPFVSFALFVVKDSGSPARKRRSTRGIGDRLRRAWATVLFPKARSTLHGRTLDGLSL